MSFQGGYDDGYSACPCFWGQQPGTLVTRLMDLVPDVRNLRVLDAGCGEGKNAHALACKGANVTAVECSELALKNARATWAQSCVEWIEGDIRDVTLPLSIYDIVIAYGLLHCLPSPADIHEVVKRLQALTSPGGWHVICAFNDRRQELSAHPGFHPCLLSHSQFLDMYRGWELMEATDRDLFETHPHNSIPHTHSLTRFIARKP